MANTTDHGSDRSERAAAWVLFDPAVSFLTPHWSREESGSYFGMPLGVAAGLRFGVVVTLAAVASATWLTLRLANRSSARNSDHDLRVRAVRA